MSGDQDAGEGVLQHVAEGKADGHAADARRVALVARRGRGEREEAEIGNTIGVVTPPAMRPASSRGGWRARGRTGGGEERPRAEPGEEADGGVAADLEPADGPPDMALPWPSGGSARGLFGAGDGAADIRQTGRGFARGLREDAEAAVCFQHHGADLRGIGGARSAKRGQNFRPGHPL